MNRFIKGFLSATRNLPAVSSANDALIARLTGINPYGITGALSINPSPPENNRLLRDGYMDNHIVFTVCDWKAQQFARAVPLVYEIKDKKSFKQYKSLSPFQKAENYALRLKSLEEIDDPSDRMVRTLRQPNPGQTWAELAYAVSVYLDFGNSLVYGSGPTAGANAGQFHELYLLPTALFSGQEPTVGGYRYFVDSSGVNKNIPGSQVMHIRRFNALTEGQGGGLWGMSKLAPARRVLLKSTLAQEAEAELFQNRGARAIIFPKKGQNVEDETGEQAIRAGDAIRRKFKSAGHGGLATNSLELGVIQLGMDSDDLKLMESNALVEKQVCALWHVDVIAVFSAVTEASRANGETAVKKSLIEGVLPDLNLFAGKLNQWFVEPYNRSGKYQRYIEFNTDVYPQLQTDKKDIASWLNATILSANDRNEMFGFERSTEPGMDIPLVPPGFTPITDLMAPDKPKEEPKNDNTYGDEEEDS